jgi:hypothetical protein
MWMEHGKILPRPPMSPEQAGKTLAVDLMVFKQDPVMDELGETPLAKRWSKT